LAGQNNPAFILNLELCSAKKGNQLVNAKRENLNKQEGVVY